MTTIVFHRRLDDVRTKKADTFLGMRYWEGIPEEGDIVELVEKDDVYYFGRVIEGRTWRGFDPRMNKADRGTHPATVEIILDIFSEGCYLETPEEKVEVLDAD